ncbi:MAG: GHMP kinase [Kiritimatiellia bacterium]|jgi:glucuronokinase|nr:GHMP kinase [Kiritimatiellia bacterium]
MIIRTTAYPRAALIGNPSDGYYGKTIAFTFSNFSARVTLYESPELEIMPTRRDGSIFTSIGDLFQDVRLFGYYGGIRLLKAAIKSFYGYCRENEIELHDRNFTVRYDSDIPNLVGLAGSSAIITATLRALMSFYGVTIARPQLANLIRAVENRELGITAGLQDRVAQVYQSLVYMDFDRPLMERQGFGRYEPLDAAALPPLYIAFRTDLSEGSEVVHNNLRERFERGEPEVLAAMAYWADLAVQARQALEKGDGGELGRLMNANFDKRREICALGEGNLRLVETARQAGASAKFTGSGGAIIGTYPDERAYARLAEAFAAQQVCVFKPVII